jgi:hypothetical protein
LCLRTSRHITPSRASFVEIGELSPSNRISRRGIPPLGYEPPVTLPTHAGSAGPHHRAEPLSHNVDGQTTQPGPLHCSQVPYTFQVQKSLYQVVDGFCRGR